MSAGDRREPVIRVIEPTEGVLAFYAGRDGSRYAPEPNWVDAGAISLGIASYALIAGADALVYDTGISPAWGEFVLAELQRRGAERIRVVLSHHHLDHIAGTAAFGGVEIIANARTAEILARDRVAIERGELDGPPAISPLVLPNRTFSDHETLQIGSGGQGVSVQLLTFDIHSDDATVLWLPDRRLLLAGDTVEDTVTYVVEAHRLTVHRRELARLRALDPQRILPNHGSPARITAGGYPPELIDATREYIDELLSTGPDPRQPAKSLQEVLATLPSAHALEYLPDYEAVHAQNLRAVADARPRTSD